MATNHLKEIGEKAKEDAKDLIGKKVVGISSIQKKEANWEVVLELLERKAVPDTQNILGSYKFIYSEEGELQSYERTGLRRKADTELEESLEEEIGGGE